MNSDTATLVDSNEKNSIATEFLDSILISTIGFIFLIGILILLLFILNLIGVTMFSITVAFMSLVVLLYPFVSMIKELGDPAYLGVSIIYLLIWTIVAAGLLFGAYELLRYLYLADIIAIPNRFFPIII